LILILSTFYGILLLRGRFRTWKEVDWLL